MSNHFGPISDPFSTNFERLSCSTFLHFPFTFFAAFSCSWGLIFKLFHAFPCVPRFPRLSAYLASCRSCFRGFQGSMGRRVPALALTIVTKSVDVLLFFGVALALVFRFDFSTFFRWKVASNSLVLSLRGKRRRSEKCNTLHTKTCFIKVRACAGATTRKGKISGNVATKLFRNHQLFFIVLLFMVRQALFP